MIPLDVALPHRPFKDFTEILEGLRFVLLDNVFVLDVRYFSAFCVIH